MANLEQDSDDNRRINRVKSIFDIEDSEEDSSSNDKLTKRLIADAIKETDQEESSGYQTNKLSLTSEDNESAKSETMEVSSPKSETMEVSSPKSESMEVSSPKSESMEASSPKSESMEAPSPKSESMEASSPKSESMEVSSHKSEILETDEPPDKSILASIDSMDESDDNQSDSFQPGDDHRADTIPSSPIDQHSLETSADFSGFLDEDTSARKKHDMEKETVSLEETEENEDVDVQMPAEKSQKEVVAEVCQEGDNSLFEQVKSLEAPKFVEEVPDTQPEQSEESRPVNHLAEDLTLSSDDSDEEDIESGMPEYSSSFKSQLHSTVMQSSDEHVDRSSVDMEQTEENTSFEELHRTELKCSVKSSMESDQEPSQDEEPTSQPDSESISDESERIFESPQKGHEITIDLSSFPQMETKSDHSSSDSNESDEDIITSFKPCKLIIKPIKPDEPSLHSDSETFISKTVARVEDVFTDSEDEDHKRVRSPIGWDDYPHKRRALNPDSEHSNSNWEELERTKEEYDSRLEEAGPELDNPASTKNKLVGTPPGDFASPRDDLAATEEKKPYKKQNLKVNLPALMKAFEQGWVRELVTRGGSSGTGKSDVYYYAPDKKKLRSKAEVETYLISEDITYLSADNFSFAKSALGLEPKYEVLRVASMRPPTTTIAHGSPAKTTPRLGRPKAPPKRALDLAVSPSSMSGPNKIGLKLPRISQPTLLTPRAPGDDINKTFHCTPTCPLALDPVPSLQCVQCVCLFHPECVKMPAKCVTLIIVQQVCTFLCPNCYNESRRANPKPSFRDPEHYEPHSFDPSDDEDEADLFPYIDELNLRKVPIRPESPLERSQDSFYQDAPPTPSTIPVQDQQQKPEQQSVEVQVTPIVESKKDFVPSLIDKYNTLKIIFSYLSVRDLLNCASVCQLWKDMVYHPDLWQKVSLRNTLITDWEKMGAFLRNRSTQKIDMRKMRFEELMLPDPPKETPSDVSQEIEDEPMEIEESHASPLPQSDISHITTAILHEHAYSGSVAIREQSDDIRDQSDASETGSVCDQDASKEQAEDKSMKLPAQEQAPSEEGPLLIWHYIAMGLASIDTLKWVVLGSCDPIHVQIVLYYCRQLEAVTCYSMGNTIQDNCFDPSYLMHTKDLETLHLTSISFTMKSNFNFIKLPQLTHLTLNGLKTLQGWPYLGTNLVSVSLSPINAFTASNWKNLSNMNVLETLELGGGMLHQDQDLCAVLQKLTTLKRLSLQNWHVGSRLPHVLRKSSNIKQLAINPAQEGKGMEGVYAGRVIIMVEHCKQLHKLQWSVHPASIQNTSEDQEMIYIRHIKAGKEANAFEDDEPSSISLESLAGFVRGRNKTTHIDLRKSSVVLVQ